MFGKKKEDDVDVLLEEGMAFVAKLDTCVSCTESKAEEVQSEISKLEAERNELDRKVKKGKVVSKRIAAILEVTDEDLEKD